MTASLSSTSAPGLSAAEARRRLLAHGPNALPEAARTPRWLRLARHRRRSSQLVFAYPARRIGARLLPNPALHLSIAGCAALTAGALLVPWLRDALGLVPLDTGLWLVVLGAVAGTWLAAEALGWWVGPWARDVL